VDRAAAMQKISDTFGYGEGKKASHRNAPTSGSGSSASERRNAANGSTSISGSGSSASERRQPARESKVTQVSSVRVHAVHRPGPKNETLFRNLQSPAYAM
jgi:hypothetical protein